MTFGEAWGWGASRDESRRIFDAFVGRGGNFVDTASNYTDGESERFVGEFVASERDRFVVATKYTLTSRRGDPNAGGNHRKNLVRSLEGSLRRLSTDHVDILYLHMWDGTTPVEEVLRAMDDLVRSGKVLHVGFSDTPAWVVSRAVAIAELRGWSLPVAIQAPYSVADRSVERELLPMAFELGLSVAAWGVLEGGALTGKYREPSSEPRRYDRAGERVMEVAEEVAAVAKELDSAPSQVAIAWVRHHGTLVIPIVGARSVRQMKENLDALDVELTREHADRLDRATAFELGFPRSFLEDDEVRELIFGDTYGLIDRGHSPYARG
jgi:aryl-alcohol dehydrogenase-like predicted oxidoreductase